MIGILNSKQIEQNVLKHIRGKRFSNTNAHSLESVYMEISLKRVENGDPNYWPQPSELGIVGNEIYRYHNEVTALKNLGLIPEDYRVFSPYDVVTENDVRIEKNTRGIYAIKCRTGVYIGLSQDVRRRIRNHLNQIEKGTHIYIDVNDDPKIFLLEDCGEKATNEALLKREAYWAEKAIKQGLNVLNEENWSSKRGGGHPDRREKSIADLTKGRIQTADNFALGEAGIFAMICSDMGMSLNAIVRALEIGGYKTARGNTKWAKTTASRLVKRHRRLKLEDK